MQRKLKYYHASKAKFKKGDRISACSSSVVGKNYNCSNHGIYMTTSPYVHCTVIDDAAAEKWYVYEVEPIDLDKIHRGMWDEFIANEVEVVRKVGRVTEVGKGLGKFCSYVPRTRNGFRTVLIEKKPKQKVEE